MMGKQGRMGFSNTAQGKAGGASSGAVKKRIVIKPFKV